jgi:glycosyltransferase involved in cell wall biosynthesis
MAVYNGARYVRQAIDSILAQTFTDFELVIVDDGSTDETPQILASYRDPRIVRVENAENLGLTKSLNRGIRASRGELIARQDADDASMPKRLEKQVAYMDTHPTVGLVGSGSRWIDGQGALIREWRPLTDPAEIQQTLLAAVPFLHGTFMFRRDCLSDIGGGYGETKPVAQDCDLLLRLSERWDVANLPDILYTHRRHSDTVTAKRGAEQQHHLQLAQRAAIHRRLTYGWGRLGLSRVDVPKWVKLANRRWLAQRYTWWSASARQIGRRLALRFLLIALFLDPTTPSIWSYIRGIFARKIGRE